MKFYRLGIAKSTRNLGLHLYLQSDSDPYLKHSLIFFPFYYALDLWLYYYHKGDFI